MINELMDIIAESRIAVGVDREKLHETIKKLALLSQCKSSNVTYDKKLYKKLLNSEEIQRLINDNVIHRNCINRIKMILARRLSTEEDLTQVINELWSNVKIPSRPARAAVITYLILKSNGVNITMQQASNWFNVSQSSFRKWIKKYRNMTVDPPRGAVTCQEMRK